jgi:hypothetical protein
MEKWNFTPPNGEPVSYQEDIADLVLQNFLSK